LIYLTVSQTLDKAVSSFLDATQSRQPKIA
jgi:hypothetical protein